MKKAVSISIACIIAIMTTGCYVNCDKLGFNNKQIIGNGIIKEQSRGNLNFSAINASGSVDVFVSNATDSPVMVSGDENLIDSIETIVENDVLYVRFKKGFGYSSKKGLKVTVPNNGHITAVTSSGSSDVMIEGVLVSDNITISCKGSSDFKGSIKAHTCKLSFSGSSDFKGDVDASTCEISCAGSSDCIITGKADNCNASLSGSSDLKGYDFVVETLDSSSSGSSDIQITCNKELSVRASGSSDVNYKGTATIISKKLSGSSDLNHK